jgi:hypothetical protein
MVRFVRGLREAWGLFFNPMAVVPFLIGVVALAVLGNGVFSWAWHHFFADSYDRLWELIAWTFAIVLICVVLVAVLGPVHGAVRRWLARPAVIVEHEVLKISRRGVIFTLGLKGAEKNSVPRWVLDRLKPEFVGFLGTPETDAAGIVERLAADYDLEPAWRKSESWVPTAFAEGKIKAGLVIDWMREQGVDSCDIVLDLTGGLVPMSLVASLAAQERQVDCQYIVSKYDQKLGQVIDGTQRPILVTQFPRPEPKAADSPGSRGGEPTRSPRPDGGLLPTRDGEHAATGTPSGKSP